MASVKAVLRKKKSRSDGTYPLAIRITKDRKSSFIHLGYQLRPDQWDKAASKVKKHQNSARLNNLIAQKIAEITEQMLTEQVGKMRISAKGLKDKVNGTSDERSFFFFADNYLKDLRLSGKYNRFSADKPRVERFKEFLGGSDIAFQDITLPLLRRFRSYLKSTRNIEEITIVNHLVVLRTVFNQAIQSDLVDVRLYPFGKRGMKLTFPQSVKIGLNQDEITLLEKADLSAHYLQDHARNVWLVSFYFAGMRVSDVLRLKWADFQDGRLHYVMGKNDKAGSIKVPDRASKILAFYKESENAHGLVFPDLSDVADMKDKFQVQKRIAKSTASLNGALGRLADRVGITKKLSMHIARHTFGNLSGDKIPIQMLQKLYRHSHISTTVNYQGNFIFKDTDDALDMVIGE